jgi:hypothetical protein
MAWWDEEPPQQEHIAKDSDTLRVEVKGTNSDVVVIHKKIVTPSPKPGGPTTWGINVWADWIHDGHIYIPVIAGDVVVAVCGTNGPDVVYLYGITRDGHVVAAQPPQDKANGRRTAKYEGQNQVSVTEIGGGPYKSRYCWDGSDWTQGGETTCDPRNHCRLVALRKRNEGFKVIREPYIGP